MNRKKKLKKELDDILVEFQKVFSEKIESITTDTLLEDIIRAKDQEIFMLKTLQENDEILKKLDTLESINNSYLFRTMKGIRMKVFRIPFLKKLFYLLRRWI